MVFAQSADVLGGARALPNLAALPWISAAPAADATLLSAFESVAGTTAVERAYAAADHSTVAKILFTSGSTGTPKGVPNTQGMLYSAVRAAGLLVPVDAPPITVDWMPWHHTLGGNSTLHSILRDGGTMYIDDGRPLAGLVHHTIRNLTRIATIVNELSAYNLTNAGATRRIAAFVVLDDAPSMAAGEITDKGYVN